MAMTLSRPTMPKWSTGPDITGALLRTVDIVTPVLRPLLVSLAIMAAASWWTLPDQPPHPVTAVPAVER